eukprot:CAMPEP_0184869166 /NCGR_PEP_ID=MMETSP0580-20130426/33190_1 /TAXON_ID=1118495 /ORGANISM="Dactyliosolen fragilissimus" /LENGTH=760 /DNA_ID=CAMNT_0027370485 /DNA_START=101 /DNA_END=2383 /DNA_ORIENTATION=-
MNQAEAASARARREDFLRRLEKKQQVDIKAEQKFESENNLQKAIPNLEKQTNVEEMQVSDDDYDSDNAMQLDESERSSVVKYLSICGLPRDEYQLINVDKSSLMLLIQLSRKREESISRKEHLEIKKLAKFPNVTNSKTAMTTIFKKSENKGSVKNSKVHLNMDENEIKTFELFEKEHKEEITISNLASVQLKNNQIVDFGSHSQFVKSDTNANIQVKLSDNLQCAGSEIEELFDQHYKAHFSSDSFSNENDCNANDISKDRSIHNVFTKGLKKSNKSDVEDEEECCCDVESITSANQNVAEKPEVWQKCVLDKMEIQHKAILKCQEQIHSLAKLVSILAEHQTTQYKQINPTNSSGKQNFSEESFQSKNQFHASEVDFHSAPQSVQARTQQHKVTYTIQKLFNFIFSASLRARTVFAMSRPCRLLTLIYKEAQNPNGRIIRFLDFGLIIRTFFVCYIFAARMRKGTSTELNENDSDRFFFAETWNKYRISIFIFCAVVTYFLQTGVLQFLYRTLIKEDGFGRIWRNDDLLHNEENQDDGGTMKHDDNITLNESKSISQQRRGRKDRIFPDNQQNEVNNLVNGNFVPAGPRYIDQNSSDQNNNNVNKLSQIFKGTFVSGVIPRRMKTKQANRQNVDSNEYDIRKSVDSKRNKHKSRKDEQDTLPILQNNSFNLFAQFCTDLYYFIASFFLSLLPMWRFDVVEEEASQMEGMLPVESGNENAEEYVKDEDLNSNEIVEGNEGEHNYSDGDNINDENKEDFR